MMGKSLRAALAILAFTASHAFADAPDAGKSRRTVRIYRDDFGLAHLYARHEEDGFYGLGYAVGEDRLREVLAYYIAVRGELAVTFGPITPLPYQHDAVSASPTPMPDYLLADAVATDRRALKYQYLRWARRNLSKLPQQYQKDLRGYVQGLRTYMRDHPEETPSWAPPLEPALPLAVFDLIVSQAAPVCSARREADEKTSPPRMSNADLLPLSGSNAWAVAGARTSDGGVYLESDSHSPIEEYGTFFYPYRIKAGDLDFLAFDPAGTVMFLFGYSPHFAWGITDGPHFVADCYRIKTDPKSPRQYLYDGKRRTITALNYRIRIKGAPAERGTFEYARVNGILAPVESREGDAAYVVSYVSAERVGLTAAEHYQMAIARTRVELETALARRDGYPGNLVIGGADGTIMYIRPERIPVRPIGVDVRHILDGNTSATTWQGIHSYQEALKLINPPQGYIGNCNVSPDMMYPMSPLQPENYPDYFGFQPGHTNSRQIRLIELLEHSSSLSVETAKAIAMDETIPSIRAWGPAFEEILRTRPDLIKVQPAIVQRFFEDLAAFDGTFNKESRGALAHSELRLALAENHPKDNDAIAQAINEHAVLTGEQQQILVRAVAEAVTHLLGEFGTTDLTWGDVHRVGRGPVDLPVGGARVFVGSNGADAPPKREATLRQLTFRADPLTKRLWLTGSQRVPFIVHYGPNGVQSYAETLFGVSDNPSSPHYSDQASLASEKILRPIPTTEIALEREHAGLVSLSIRTN